ncbi:substrate-binding domain-containing protein [Rhodococcus sp. T2V]|uniref:substrate-binding domain-containing protein n=1 Tax=Rhodococcus sp. T2V TaxID=3034164 RepID=UPI0023E0B85D|nr:substrate-binding domain-containing protein [Rhodococcus sp. T2V]
MLGKCLIGAVTVAAAVACSSTGGKPADAGAGSGAGTADTPRMTVAMVTHAPQGDVFWSMVQKGAEAAAAKDNVELLYSSDDDPGRQANLVQSAIDSKVDAIAVSLAKPDAVASAIAAADAAGIPVVALNAGLDDWQRLGTKMFFGLDIEAAGKMSGEQLAGAGGKHALCVIQEQGNVVLEQMCQGAGGGFGTGKVDTLYVQGSDMPSVQSALTAKLQQDRSIDSIVTLNAPIGMAALTSRSEAGSSAEITTVNVTPEVASAIESGDILAAVDQQGWLQGYLAVDSLWLYQTNNNVIGGGQPVLTGPTLVNRDNIAAIAPLVDKGTR